MTCLYLLLESLPLESMGFPKKSCKPHESAISLKFCTYRADNASKTVDTGLWTLPHPQKWAPVSIWHLHYSLRDDCTQWVSCTVWFRIGIAVSNFRIYCRRR